MVILSVQTGLALQVILGFLFHWITLLDVGCGTRLESWGKENFRNLNKEKKILQEKISSFSSLHDFVCWNVLKESEKNLNILLDKEERFWIQRRRVSGLKDGGRNTKYFHLKAFTRRKTNEIICLCDYNGY